MNSTSIKKLSEHIKLQRFISKKTQDDCAKVLDISIPTYKNYEDNPNKLNLDQAIILFDYIGDNIEDIFLKYVLQNAIKEE